MEKEHISKFKVNARWLLFVFSIASVSLFASDNDPGEKTWSLSECIDYAMTNSIKIKQTELDQLSAEINKDKSSYNRLPSVYARSVNNMSNGYRIDPITSSFVNQQILSNSYGLYSDLTLYNGSSLNKEMKKSNLLIEKNEIIREEVENEIKLKITELYLQSLFHYENYLTNQNVTSSSELQLSQAKVKFESGAISKGDLATIETQYHSDKYNEVVSLSNYEQSVLSLKQLLELNPEEEFELEKPVIEVESFTIPDKQEVFSYASENFPNLKKYEAEKKIQEVNIELIRAKYAPSASLGASITSGYTNSLNVEYFDQLNNNFNQQVSLSLNFPIFSKFQNKEDVKLTEVEIKKNELNKEQEVKTLYSTIETAWQNAKSNNAKYESAKIAKRNALIAYEIAQENYLNGGATLTELEVAKNNYLSNEGQFIQAKFQTLLYVQVLNYYQGKFLGQL